MNADRESNRLPLRAGAMLLLAVAIVFGALGIHSVATSGNDPEADLRAAQSSAPATTTSSAATSSSAAASDVTAKVCVINAGEITGLADEVDTELTKQGFTTQGINSESNYSAGGFSDNTIVYSTAGQRSQAQTLNQALGGDYDVDARSALGATFSRCQGGIAVVVVTR